MRGGPPGSLCRSGPKEIGFSFCTIAPMNVSATVALWGCVVLAALSLGGAYAAYDSLDTLADAAEREAMHSYVGLALFMFGVSVALGVVCVLIRSGRLGKGR